MMNLRLLILVFCGLLVACSETNNASEDQKIPAVIPADIPPVPSEIDIQETALPIIEDFGAANSIEFFSPTYKPLATPASHALSDGTTLVDTLPSFFYPTCCLFQTDDVTGQQLRDPPQYADDINFRLKVGQNKMAISNARFTIGQILSDLTPENVVDRKVNTTNGAIAVLGSWGELDLSRPYRISFCLVDVLGSSNLEVYADNNSGGSQAQSIHGSLSLLLRTPVTGLTSGNRLVIEVPGNVFQVDNSGNQIGNPLGVASSLQVGRSRSFIQIRVSSGGHVVISDLVIERQSQNNAEGMTCAADTTFWAPPFPEDLELVPNNAQIAVTWSGVAGAASYDIAHNTAPTTSGATVVSVTAPATNTTLTGLPNDVERFVFIRARYSNGRISDYSPGVSATPSIPTVPPNTPDNLDLTAGDEQISVTWDASPAAIAYDVAYNTTNPNVPAGDPGDALAGTVTDIVTTGTTILGLTNGTTYHVFVRAKNSAGNSAYSNPGVSATPMAPAAGVWTGAALDLIGSAGGIPSGSIGTNTSSAITITATGGDMGSTVFRTFYAYQQGVTIPFTLTARLASITKTGGGTFASTGNSRRYGVMVMESLNPAANYAELGRFASLEFYASASTPAFTGSRAEKRDILFVATDPVPQSTTGTTRGRGDVAAMAVGDYLRVSVAMEGADLVVRRYFSSDGVNFAANEITTNNMFLNGNNHPFPTDMYVGFFAAPNADELTLVWDNVSLTQP